MYKYWEIKDMKICIYLLLLTLNVLQRVGKCTRRGTCAPDWEPLHQSLGTKLGGVKVRKRGREYGSDLLLKSRTTANTLLFCFSFTLSFNE